MNDTRETLYEQLKASGEMSVEALRRWRVAQRLAPDPTLPEASPAPMPAAPVNVTLERPTVTTAPRRRAPRRRPKSRKSRDLSARWDLEI